jgi:DNA-directed RNA polymerase specialized sigma24 family protein
LSQREIASEKALPLGTVKTRLNLALKKLLNQLTAAQETL